MNWTDLRHALRTGCHSISVHWRCPGWAPAAGVTTLKLLYDTSWTGFG